MKQYLLFTGSIYYPDGGWDDFKGSFDSLDEAKAACASHIDPEVEWGAWAHIVDASLPDPVRVASFNNKL